MHPRGVHCHDHCHSGPDAHGAAAPPPPGYRRALWIALIVNAAMAAVEVTAGLHAGSVSLLADAIDFLGDAANYGVSLFVLGMALAWRARGDMRTHSSSRCSCRCWRSEDLASLARRCCFCSSHEE
jgi:Co/Zn/Cd efflux system component